MQHKKKTPPTKGVLRHAVIFVVDAHAKTSDVNEPPVTKSANSFRAQSFFLAL